VDEGGVTRVTISMSRASTTPTTVHYSISGDATLGQDYTLSGTPGSVVIPAGQLSATIAFTALRDNVIEKQEIAQLTLTDATRGKKFVKIFINKQDSHGHHR